MIHAADGKVHHSAGCVAFHDAELNVETATVC